MTTINLFLLTAICVALAASSYGQNIGGDGDGILRKYAEAPIAALADAIDAYLPEIIIVN